MISVLTLTNRSSDALYLVEKALKRQTFKGFEWVIGSPEKNITKNLTLPFTWVEDPPKEVGDVWCLNKAYNKCIKACTGDLIISVQDFTFFDPDALEKFLFYFMQEPKTIVTGVGNKYSAVYPELGECVWQDPRINSHYGTYYPCYFNDIEGNFCSIPKKALMEIGGFDEDMDKYFGMDFYSVLDRLNIKGGWEFKINQTIKSYSLPHDRPNHWDEKNLLSSYHKYRVKYLENPVLKYF